MSQTYLSITQINNYIKNICKVNKICYNMLGDIYEVNNYKKY